MRELKFRAFDNQDNKMSAPFDITDPEINYRDEDGVYMARSYDLDCGDFEVMQYTGVKDREGKEICESDLCLGSNGKKYEIIFHNGGFYCKNIIELTLISIGEFCDFGFLKVIGNIYET